MTDSKTYLAVDLGAGSGRVLAGIWDHDQLTLEEIHRFENSPLQLPDGDHWDLPALYGNILLGLKKAAERFGPSIQSLGIDTWGVDYGLLDRGGRLLGLPYQYRDARTQGMEEAAAALVPREEIYQATGIQFAFFNTLNQLMAEAKAPTPLLELAEDLLFIPDLLGYWLTGKKVQERSIASTSQLYNPRTRDWDHDLIARLGLPSRLFKSLQDPGQALGPLREPLQKNTGLNEIPVISVGGHDTASAVAAVPGTDPTPAFLSSGTWSLMGLELPAPIISESSFADAFTNEVGLNGTIRFLKNICGLWLIQECRRTWQQEGNHISYADMASLATPCQPFRSLIFPDDPRFASAGDMPQKISAACSESGQPAPESEGQLIRCIYESLALRYAQVWQRLLTYTETPPTTLHVVGGGCQEDMLNQFTANAIGAPVTARPVEATGIGNLLSQMIADGTVQDLPAGRRIVAASFPTTTYSPADPDVWQEARNRFDTLYPAGAPS